MSITDDNSLNLKTMLEGKLWTESKKRIFEPTLPKSGETSVRCTLENSTFICAYLKNWCSESPAFGKLQTFGGKAITVQQFKLKQ